MFIDFFKTLLGIPIGNGPSPAKFTTSQLQLGPGKVKHLPDRGGLLDVAGPLAPGIVIHGALLVQLVAEVAGSLHPRESVTVQDYLGGVGDLADLAAGALALLPVRKSYV